MQNDLKHHHLAFLLSLGAMPLAGCTVNGDDDDTNATTQATTVSTTVSTSDTDPTTVSTTDPTGETSNSTTAGTDPTADTGTTDPTGGTDPDGTGTTGEIPATCQTFADKYVECYPRYARYAAEIASGCAGDLDTYAGYGADCGTAADDFYACLGALDCAAFTDKEPDCTAETMALEEACPVVSTSSGFDTSGSSGG